MSDLCNIHTYSPGGGGGGGVAWIATFVGLEKLSSHTVSVLIVFCVGGSKELTVLCESHSTAAFVLQHCFELYKS